jgi:hypothetical protein
MKMQMFGFRRNPRKPEWIWLGGCAKWLKHNGWVCLNWKWFVRFGITEPIRKYKIKINRTYSKINVDNHNM